MEFCNYSISHNYMYEQSGQGVVLHRKEVSRHNPGYKGSKPVFGQMCFIISLARHKENHSRCDKSHLLWH